ncbi:MAG: hypothetical protein EZS28_010178 [Streblomastix strix]|uniref:Uncharacterized protein n=1 Tax=Streblomastix strix TaxID=222440 RepID=A0A5J4WI78_9EUKA|nr:MAG: hypothetical protein EZS28_010178 [Streblomastix strix]
MNNIPFHSPTRGGVPRLVRQFQPRSVINDIGKKCIDVKEVHRMKRCCPAESLGQDKATCKFCRILELSKTKNQEGRTISMNVEQDQITNNEQRRIVGANTQIIEHEREDLIPGRLVQEVDVIQQLPTRDSRRSLRSNRFGVFLKEQEGHSTETKADNSATSCNLNRRAATASFLKLTDRILKVVEDLNIQIHSFHIKRKTNLIPVSLSRLATSGGYSLKEEILQEAPTMLRIEPKVDMRKCRRLKDRTKDEKQRKHLPPGRMMIAVIEGREENHYSSEFYNKEDQIMKPFKELLMNGVNSYWNAFRAIGQEEQKINGFALKQTMKKPSIQVAKQLSEEPIWRFNKFLKYGKTKL